jgi:hypothetical protein
VRDVVGVVLLLAGAARWRWRRRRRWWWLGHPAGRSHDRGV